MNIATIFGFIVIGMLSGIVIGMNIAEIIFRKAQQNEQNKVEE